MRQTCLVKAYYEFAQVCERSPTRQGRHGPPLQYSKPNPPDFLQNFDQGAISPRSAYPSGPTRPNRTGQDKPKIHKYVRKVDPMMNQSNVVDPICCGAGVGPFVHDGKLINFSRLSGNRCRPNQNGIAVIAPMGIAHMKNLLTLVSPNCREKSTRPLFTQAQRPIAIFPFGVCSQSMGEHWHHKTFDFVGR